MDLAEARALAAERRLHGVEARAEAKEAILVEKLAALDQRAHKVRPPSTCAIDVVIANGMLVASCMQDGRNAAVVKVLLRHHGWSR